MLNKKIEKKRIATMITAVVIVLGAFLATNATIFYYKYINANLNLQSDHEKRAFFLMDKYLNAFKQMGEDEQKYAEFLSSNTMGEAYLLRFDKQAKLKIIASSVSADVAESFLQNECGSIYGHDFKTDYYKHTILGENRIKVCYFVNTGKYIIGYRHMMSHSINGIDDVYFKEWLVKNLTPSFMISFILALLSGLIALWGINKYFDNMLEMISSRMKFKRNIKQMKDLLYIDPVTKLSNKIALMNSLKELDKPKIVVIDIDDFGMMNDYYGKEICDEILMYIANLIKEFAKNENMRPYCIGADQFALVENGEFFIDRYEALATDLTSKFKGRLITIKDEKTGENLEIEVHTTIGFALDEKDTLMKATTALKVAKTAKKDFVCYFKGLNKKDEYTAQIQRSILIRQAIINNTILPYYQPIFDSNLNIVKYECLIRISDNGEIVSPYLFLDVSRRIKRYAELQKMIIQSAIEKLNNDPNLVLSLNLSGRDMLDGDVSVFIIRLLNQYNVADRLILELVEDENLENVERIENFIDKVKNIGVKIAIDDFGSGYSNFSYILKLRPDYIKIDGTLIKNMDSNKDSYKITSAIVSFAKDLGIKIIAEYIHSREIFDICIELGIDEFQGFYLGMPTDKIGHVS